MTQDLTNQETLKVLLHVAGAIAGIIVCAVLYANMKIKDNESLNKKS